MAKLSNTPRQQMTFDLERRKSYSFRCVLLHADRFPLDLTGCTLRFVMKREEYDEDLFDTTNQLINSEALILSPESGEGTFSFQAAELDGPPGAYNYAIVLWTRDGYSVVVTKGTVNLHPNTDSRSIMQSYTTNTADAALEITLRGNDVLNIVTNTLTRSEARVEIIGTGRPDDAATLEANTINEVANARVGTLFISLDGAGINAWAWRKRRDGWFIVEGMPLQWSDIQGRPAQFPPSSHGHSWSEITGKPTKFNPADHTHGWGDLTGVPSAFNPSPHVHNWTEIAGKPSVFVPAAHSHKWSDLTQVPTSFTPSAHSHSWAEVTDKPSTFAPSAHSHSWAEVTGKPSTFAPSAHTHPVTELTASGTRDATTFLRGDNTWAEVDLASVTSREYWGPGRPDVAGSLDSAGAAWVAAATAGAVFHSVNGPQGAWTWQKRGTTWVCVDGDTGQVDLAAYLTADWELIPTSGRLTGIRIGRLLRFTILVQLKAGSSRIGQSRRSQVLLTSTVSLRWSVTQDYTPATPALIGPAAVSGVIYLDDNGRLAVTGTETGNWAAGDRVRATVVCQSGDGWPLTI